MGLETATTIEELNPDWPTGTDPKSQGDDHIRMIKAVLQADAIAKSEPGALTPTGAVMAYAATGQAPSGYLFCNGLEVSRDTYEALYAVIGDTFGAGDGSTTFNLPDLQGRVIAGREATASILNSGGIDSTVVGSVGGDDTHTLTVAEMPAHTHTYEQVFGAAGGTGTSSGGAGPATANTGSAGSGIAHNNVQPTIVLNYIIKT